MKNILLACLIFNLTTHAIAGQGRVMANKNKSVTIASHYQNWNVQHLKANIIEGSFPLEFNMKLNPQFKLKILNFPAMSYFGSEQLTGISDTWIGSSYWLNENLALTGVLGVPTGKTALTNEEAYLDSLLNQDIFKFRSPLFGQGWNISLGIAYAKAFKKRYAIGGGMTYVFSSAYKYVDSIKEKYNPGNLMILNIGGDYLLTPQFAIETDFLLFQFGKDQLGNSDVFSAAMRKVIRVGLKYQTTKWLINTTTRIRLSGKSDKWDNSERRILPETEDLSTLQRELNWVYQYNFSRMIGSKMLIEIKSNKPHTKNYGRGNIFGYGFGLNYSLSMAMHFYFQYLHSSGNGYINEKKSSISGTEIIIQSTYYF